LGADRLDGVGVRGDGVYGAITNGTESGLRAYNRAVDPVGVHASAWLAVRNPPTAEAPHPGNAAVFFGDVEVIGSLNKLGGGFLIDHPVDPGNRYLRHSFVEAAERRNLYDGVTTLDADGTATVELPTWCPVLNEDFRYQLTAIGAPAPNLHIAKEMQGHRFVIAGGSDGIRVSWQLTGRRTDPWAVANPLSVEEEKSLQRRGYYLQPELHGEPTDRHIAFASLADGIAGD
jgi:hypothetical protein